MQACTVLLAFAFGQCIAASPDLSLEEGFLDPPVDARPLAWWHWMNGNVSSDGIAADLAWMKRAGIGGVQYADIGLRTPAVVPDPVHFSSPAWEKAIGGAVAAAADRDLEFGIFSSPGWSVTGGPWVKPEQAMKKLVWSSMRIAGGQAFRGKLPDLPAVAGPFQNVPASTGWLQAENAATLRPRFSADVRLLAFPVPAGYDSIAGQASYTSSFGAVDAVSLTDDDDTTGLAFPANGPKRAEGFKRADWIQLQFPDVVTVRSLTVSLNQTGARVRVRASADGVNWQPVQNFTVGAAQHFTASFAPVQAKFFRLAIKAARSAAVPGWPTALPGADASAVGDLIAQAAARPGLVLTELALREGARVNRFEAKAGFTIAGNYYDLESPPAPRQYAVDPAQVVDLTEKLATDGTLEWEAPPGEWALLRLGYSLVGSLNHPASSVGTGLEVDKLNGTHVQAYLEDYFERYSKALGITEPGIASGGDWGIRSIMTDSTEAGLQNWTEDMLAQFLRLRGYDPRPWLPALTGVVVRDGQASDRFLWDFRRTIAELIAAEHYATLSRVSRSRGLTVYGEALEAHRFSLGDDLAMRRHTDVPTGAIWAFDPADPITPSALADIGGAASVANIYGQNLVAAEMFTSALAPWSYAPRHLKHVADTAFALGVNRPIIHSSVHQPRDDLRPGISLSVFGLYLNRHETWAELARPLMDYMARSAFLLQQGRVIADIAYFYGEEAPIVGLYGHKPMAELPAGYTHDFVNSDAILNEFSVQGGKLVTRSGMQYSMLYLGGSSARMTLPVLRKLGELAAQGAVIVGDMPVSSPSLEDDPEEFARFAREVFAAYAGLIQRKQDLASVLSRLQLQPDFSFQSASKLAPDAVLFRHRRTQEADLYFVANRGALPLTLDARFRVSGKVPEVWHPDSGQRERVAWRAQGAVTEVPLKLGPHQSLFVVFRQNTTLGAWTPAQDPPPVRRQLAGPWRLEFPLSGGAAEQVELAGLQSWTQLPSPTMQYFSGTAEYRQSIEIPRQWVEQGGTIHLDLGDVRDIAQVTLNGQALGVLWKPPYTVELAAAARPGRNELEVSVTNLWVNALVGDARPGGSGLTGTSVPTYSADASLLPSGLLGPVTLEYRPVAKM